jgi:transcriptional antiterminator
LGLSLRQIRYRIERLNIAAPQDPDRDPDRDGDSPDGHDD